MLDEVLDGLDDPHFAGLSVDHREQDHRETFLHLGVLEELVENDLRLGAALKFDDDAHAVAIALVADVGDVFDVFVVDQLGDALDQDRLVYLVRNFGDDDGFAVFAESFDLGIGAHHEASAAGAVGFENSRTAVDDAGCGEIGALNEFQNLGELGAGIVDQRDGGVDDFGEVMRRNFCRHADGDSVGAVDQKIRNARRKNVRLDFAAVVVGMKVDCLFVEVFEQRSGNLRELGFGVTIGRGRISIDGAKVSLTEDERVAHRPVLGETNEGVIDSEISVRVVLAHDFADDAGAFASGPVGLQPHLRHRVENAAVDGLQSVAHVGQRAADDHRHGIIEIRPAHLLFNVDGLNVQRSGAIAATGRRSERKFRVLFVCHGSGFSFQLQACG